MDTISLWRSLTGQYDSDQGMNLGLTDSELLAKGFLLSNKSLAQRPTRSHLGRWKERQYNRKVFGLPVAFSLKETLPYINAPRYLMPPAIVELRLPLDFVTANLRVIRNVRHAEHDVILTPQMLADHLAGTKVISGECYLTDKRGGSLHEPLASTMRQYEHWYRPEGFQSGEPIGDLPFREVSLIPPINEGQSGSLR